jgi:putative membrane protein
MNKNLKIGLIVGGVVLAILIVVPSVLRGIFGWRNQYWGMMGPGMMGGFGWGWFMPIFMILFWGLVIWGIVALARGATSCSSAASHSAHADSALEVLKRRYARGEISKEEFEEKKRDLT